MMSQPTRRASEPGRVCIVLDRRRPGKLACAPDAGAVGAWGGQGRERRELQAEPGNPASARTATRAALLLCEQLLTHHFTIVRLDPASGPKMDRMWLAARRFFGLPWQERLVACLIQALPAALPRRRRAEDPLPVAPGVVPQTPEKRWCASPLILSRSLSRSPPETPGLPTNKTLV